MDKVKDTIAKVAVKNPYQYRPLVHADSIRLLKLWPGPRHETELFCNLSDHRLSENPAFEALSYVWGEPVFPRRMLTPKGFIMITESLASALTAMRLQHEPRYLWADVRLGVTLCQNTGLC